LPIVNPPGDAPLFLRLTSGCDDATRKLLATRITGYSFMLLLGSMLFGSFVLRLFDLSIAVVQVTGGALVCALGWRLLNADPKPAEAVIDRHQASDAAIARSFYPLTMPLTIDPGVMSVAVAIGHMRIRSQGIGSTSSSPGSIASSFHLTEPKGRSSMRRTRIGSGPAWYCLAASCKSRSVCVERPRILR